MASEQSYPFIFSGAVSQETGAALGVARANRIKISDIVRSALDMWLANHRWLMGQGYDALHATDYLLKQTETKQAQPQPSAPPFPSPFQAPVNGQPHVGSR